MAKYEFYAQLARDVAEQWVVRETVDDEVNCCALVADVGYWAASIRCRICRFLAMYSFLIMPV